MTLTPLSICSLPIIRAVGYWFHWSQHYLEGRDSSPCSLRLGLTLSHHDCSGSPGTGAAASSGIPQSDLAVVKATRIWIGNQGSERMLPVQWRQDSSARLQFHQRCSSSPDSQSRRGQCCPLACPFHNIYAHARAHLRQEISTVLYDFQQKALWPSQFFLFCSKRWLG